MHIPVIDMLLQMATGACLYWVFPGWLVQRELEGEGVPRRNAPGSTGFLSGQACTLAAASNGHQHLLLQVDAHDLARGPHHAGQGQGEEPHAGAYFEHGHAVGDVGRQDPFGVLPEPPEGAKQQTA